MKKNTDSSVQISLGSVHFPMNLRCHVFVERHNWNWTVSLEKRGDEPGNGGEDDHRPKASRRTGSMGVETREPHLAASSLHRNADVWGRRRRRLRVFRLRWAPSQLSVSRLAPLRLDHDRLGLGWVFYWVLAKRVRQMEAEDGRVQQPEVECRAGSVRLGFRCDGAAAADDRHVPPAHLSRWQAQTCPNLRRWRRPLDRPTPHPPTPPSDLPLLPPPPTSAASCRASQGGRCANPRVPKVRNFV